MKYICLGYAQPGKFEALSESERNTMMDECVTYDDELRKNGHFTAGEALQPANTAMTLSWKNGKVVVTDGPYAETKEQLGGILVLEARDLNHAIQLVSRHPGVKFGPFEIRPTADLNEIIEPLRMTLAPCQLETQASGARPFGPRQLLTAADLCAAIGVTPGWVYTRTKKGAIDPLPVVRLGLRGIRFDPDKISSYIRARERHRPGATLDSSDGIAPINGKGHFKLTRKRIQTGSVRLREDGVPAWWEGFYRENIVTEAGKTVRKRRAVNLGSAKEISSEKSARRKLAAILEPINDVSHRPKKKMTFRGFIEKYRTLKLSNKKGTTVDGISPSLATCNCLRSPSNRYRHSSIKSELKAKLFKPSRT